MARRPVRAARNDPRARRHDPDWEPPIPGKRRILRTWDEYMEMAKRVIERFDHQFDLQHFDYMHPVRLQKGPERYRKPYPVKVAYTEWGDRAHPTIICVGGVANTALALDSRFARRLPTGNRSKP